MSHPSSDKKLNFKQSKNIKITIFTTTYSYNKSWVLKLWTHMNSSFLIHRSCGISCFASINLADPILSLFSFRTLFVDQTLSYINCLLPLASPPSSTSSSSNIYVSVTVSTAGILKQVLPSLWKWQLCQTEQFLWRETSAWSRCGILCYSWFWCLLRFFHIFPGEFN